MLVAPKKQHGGKIVGKTPALFPVPHLRRSIYELLPFNEDRCKRQLAGGETPREMDKDPALRARNVALVT